jgi:hypothetical protein
MVSAKPPAAREIMRGEGARIEILGRSDPDSWSSTRGPSDIFLDYTAGMSHEDQLAQVRWLARLMDDNFTIRARHFASAGTRWSAISGPR